ncbi:MAG TPA: helix-turn-helix transcriptional regulator [Thermoanaerobaculia bacterium]|jgi:transcriptional regulator with XRE-family HTH domain
MPPTKGKKSPAAVKFGAHVRELRYAHDWTQEDLAERSGLNVVQISHLEGGRNEAKISTILRLAKAFGITPSKLLKPFG